MSLNDALKRIITNGQHISNQQMKMFQWLYDRAVHQILKFGDILNQSVTCIYSDMKHFDNSQHCMINLMISQIF